jgi:CDP-paratose 2-epimerase
LGSEINLKWLQSKGGFTFFEQDVRFFDQIDKTIADIKPDVIFHLAGQVAMTTSISNPRNDFEINVLGSFNILEAVKKHQPYCTIVYSSTNKVYGDLEWTPYLETEKRYIPIDFPNGFPEDIQLSFHSPYGCSKGAADQYMLDYHRVFGLNTVVFRHSSMYGGRQFSTYDQGWIGWFCQKAIETKNNTLKEGYTISGNGKQVRDLLHAEDMVSLYFAAIDHIDSLKGLAFNIGGGMSNSLSLLELFDVLEAELKVKLSYEKLPWRHSDQKVFVADTHKFSKMTSWTPKVDKLSGIRKMIHWVSEKES